MKRLIVQNSIIRGGEEIGMREQKICSWIHHIATFIGVFIGMKRLLEKRGGIIRKGILGLFLGSQLFAVCKILADMILENGWKRWMHFPLTNWVIRVIKMRCGRELIRNNDIIYLNG